jgi:peroxiredoxin
VIDGKGVVTFVFNDQFKAEAHAANALEAAKALKPVAKKGGFSFPF